MFKKTIMPLKVITDEFLKVILGYNVNVSKK